MNCKRCILIEKRKELYDHFFNKIFKEIHNFDNSNTDKLKAISNHIKDTLILHGQINVEFDGANSLFHKHKDTDQ